MCTLGGAMLLEHGRSFIAIVLIGSGLCFFWEQSLLDGRFETCLR
jgi:hypothetical protein